MSALSGDTLDAMDIIYTTARLEEFPETNYAEIPFRFCIRNGAYCTSSITREDWETKGLIGDGRYISDAEESSGAYVALIYYNELSGYNEATLSIMNDDHTITLFDKKYNIIGTYSAGSGTPIIPFLSVPDDLSLHCLAFLFHQNITSTQYNDLVRQAQNQIPGVLIFEELDLPDSETVYLYNNIILADEPTGALDSKTADEIMGVFKQLNEQGKTVIIVTHDLGVAQQCDRIIEIRDGLIANL